MTRADPLRLVSGPLLMNISGSATDSSIIFNNARNSKKMVNSTDRNDEFSCTVHYSLNLITFV